MMKNKDDLGSILGQKLKQFRKKKGLTQQQIADKVGISNVQIARYESNISQPNNKILNKITEALELPLGSFDPPFENELYDDSDLIACINDALNIPRRDRILLRAIINRFITLSDIEGSLSKRINERK